MNAPVVLDVRTASPHFPGIGRYVVGLAGALARADAPWPITLLHGVDPDPRLPLGLVRGVTCPSTPFELRQQWQVRRAIRREGPALYHSPYYLMPYAPSARTVVTCYDLIPLTVPGLFGRARRLAFRAAHALAFRTASAIIVPSAATRRDVEAYFPAHAGKLVVVPIGCDGLEAAAPDFQDGMEPFRVPQDATIVLSVGSNKPHKNLVLLLDAWTRVMDRRRGRSESLCLVLAGPRDSRHPDVATTAGRRSPENGPVVSLGHVSDQVLGRLYRTASLFVCPSKAEGFGLPALEAMASGAPVVCSRIAALSELCGDAAALVQPGDPSALAETIDRLLDAPDERNRMREAGIRRAAAFTWREAARATIAVYERVIREDR